MHIAIFQAVNTYRPTLLTLPGAGYSQNRRVARGRNRHRDCVDANNKAGSAVMRRVEYANRWPRHVATIVSCVISGIGRGYRPRPLISLDYCWEVRSTCQHRRREAFNTVFQSDFGVPKSRTGDPNNSGARLNSGAPSPSDWELYWVLRILVKAPSQKSIRALMLLHAARRTRSVPWGEFATKPSSSSRPIGP